MTHRERFHKVMSFEQVDRVPNYELCLWGHTLQRWLDEGMPEDATANGDFFEGNEFFKLERRRFAYINMGMIPGFDYQILEEDERYLLARHENGIVTKALKEGTVRGTRMSMDTYLTFPVTDRKSFEDMKKRYDPKSPGRYPSNWEEWVKESQASGDPLVLFGNGSFGVYSQLRSWVGTENISVMFYDEHTLVEEMVEFMTDFFLELSEKALREVKFDMFNFFEDLSGKGGPLISPQLFRKFVLPQYKRIIERFRKAGIKHFWVDSDGDPCVLFPMMIEAGVNCVWPLEQASELDMFALRKEYGKDLAFAGGLDKRELAKGKEAIDREMSKIPPLLESGGYFPFVDHAVSPEISYQDFLYYLEVKSKMLGHG